MKERPILFKAEMVNAILLGNKTQTRRKVNLKKWPIEFVGPCGTKDLADCWGFEDSNGMWWMLEADKDSGVESQITCPYGKVGDQLWVREAIEVDHHGSITTSKYCADGSFTIADSWPWKRDKLPSIHMPRGLSRIQLEITDIRVERLNDISEEDAQSEGAEKGTLEDDVDVLMTRFSDGCDNGYYPDYNYLEGFQNLWESISGKDSWDLNPWVWVVEFKII